MSRSTLLEIDGWTPVPDLLVTKYGLVTAMVFGKIWRYCQGKDGVCRAKLETIATELNVSKMTIIRHIETLVIDQFIEDTTPDLRNRPHIYKDTGKIAMYNKWGMGVAVTLSDSAVTESDSQSHTELIEDTIKDTIEDIKYDRKKGIQEAKERQAKQRASRKDPIDFLMENGKEIQLLKDMRIRVEAATGLNLVREWDKVRSPWNGYEKTLIKREMETRQTIEQFMEWYNSDDFRRDNQSIWLNPDKIELWWGKAFEEQPPQQEIHYVRASDDETKAAPNPLSRAEIAALKARIAANTK